MLKQGLPYIIAFVALIVLFSLLGYPLVKNKSEISKSFESDYNALKKIYASSNLPSQELIDSMRENNAQLQEEYENLREKLPATKEIPVPKSSNLPLYYLEGLKNMKEGIKDRAKGTQILTENFGLLNALPSEQDASKLIKELRIAEMVINLLLDIGVKSIDDITLSAAKSTQVCEDIPVNLKVKCDADSLTELLYTLGNTNEGFFIIRDFSLSSSMTSSDRTMSGTTTARRDSRSPSAVTAAASPTQEKVIQVNLALSLIRWK